MFSEATKVLMGLLLGERLPKISDVGFRTVESKTVLPTNDWTFCKINFYFEGLLIKGLLTWRKEYRLALGRS